MIIGSIYTRGTPIPNFSGGGVLGNFGEWAPPALVQKIRPWIQHSQVSNPSKTLIWINLDHASSETNWSHRKWRIWSTKDGGQSAFLIHKQTSLFQGNLLNVKTLIKSLLLRPQRTLDLLILYKFVINLLYISYKLFLVQFCCLRTKAGYLYRVNENINK